ncbi:hypothetical protein BV25DRAFT_1919899 [Artomyces pyxidatus]|uniref:Uncharacterized protein n=1 Tax=Artomyces pyxidatus TaxID=48021 RepID=A0ACB8SMS1_9AGAM|nr:hypothetical protein BV25DRAFT_1919899 [Artomyces pyxidatus]
MAVRTTSEQTIAKVQKISKRQRYHLGVPLMVSLSLVLCPIAHLKSSFSAANPQRLGFPQVPFSTPQSRLAAITAPPRPFSTYTSPFSQAPSVSSSNTNQTVQRRSLTDFTPQQFGASDSDFQAYQRHISEQHTQTVSVPSSTAIDTQPSGHTRGPVPAHYPSSSDLRTSAAPTFTATTVDSTTVARSRSNPSQNSSAGSKSRRGGRKSRLSDQDRLAKAQERAIKKKALNAKRPTRATFSNNIQFLDVVERTLVRLRAHCATSAPFPTVDNQRHIIENTLRTCAEELGFHESFVIDKETRQYLEKAETKTRSGVREVLQDRIARYYGLRSPALTADDKAYNRERADYLLTDLRFHFAGSSRANS